MPVLVILINFKNTIKPAVKQTKHFLNLQINNAFKILSDFYLFLFIFQMNFSNLSFFALQIGHISGAFSLAHK